MNPSTFGFRPATKGDFMAFAGAESDSLFMDIDARTGNEDQGGVAIFSPSKRTLQVHVVGHPANPMGAVWVELEGAACFAALGGVKDYVQDAFTCLAEFQLTNLGWIVG